MIEGGGGGVVGWVNKNHCEVTYSSNRRMPLPKHTVLDFEIGEYRERRNFLLESVVYSRKYFHPVNAHALSDQHANS